uniref:Uncharacterized protein n=1 Tax=Leersia perrieri TaxID=77586 RepID=A0A0D9X0T5_9ORYZ
MAERDDSLAAPSGEFKPRSQKHGQDKYAESDGHALLHRDDNGLRVLKITKRVKTGWGRRDNVFENQQQQQQNDDIYVLENTGKMISICCNTLFDCQEMIEGELANYQDQLQA